MNAEKTIGFILKQQAKFEKNFHHSNARLNRIERVLEQTNRVVTRSRPQRAWRCAAACGGTKSSSPNTRRLLHGTT